MLMATNTRPIKAARHLKNGQEGYQFVFGPSDFEENKARPHVSGYFWIRNVFVEDSKISTSTPIRIQIEFARPNVSSDTYLDAL